MILQTDRLKIRPWNDTDLAALTAMNSEPDVNKWLGGASLVDGSPEALGRYRETYEANGWGVFPIFDRADHFLGLAGFQNVAAYLPVAPAVEAVWRFRPQSWGRGYASEAIAGLLHSLPEDKWLNEAVALIATANERSARTAERIGFRRDPTGDFIHPAPALKPVLRPHQTFRLLIPRQG